MKTAACLVWTGGTSSVLATALPRPPPTIPDLSPTQGEAPQSSLLRLRRNGANSPCYSVTWWTPPSLAGPADPEDLREVVVRISGCLGGHPRYDGHIAQLLGDGLLVYFGYPQAHEDDAQERYGLAWVSSMPWET